MFYKNSINIATESLKSLCLYFEGKTCRHITVLQGHLHNAREYIIYELHTNNLIWFVFVVLDFKGL